MKAAVLKAINTPLEILDLEQDGPQQGEVRVRMKATGVCMSDWHIMNGDWPSKLPIVPGHEAAGIVEQTGPGVAKVKVGDHVIFSFAPHCGHCVYCSKGRSVLCIGHNDSPPSGMYDGTRRLKLGGEPVSQMARVGTFAEYVVCSEENVVPIRKDMPWAQAALVGCSVATGFGAVVRHAKVEAGATVMVVGCGGVGLNIVQAARLAGARKIIAVDLLDNKLEYAKRFGATDTINAKAEPSVPKAIRAMTAKLGVDYAFDAIGSSTTATQVIIRSHPAAARSWSAFPPSPLRLRSTPR